MELIEHDHLGQEAVHQHSYDDRLGLHRYWTHLVQCYGAQIPVVLPGGLFFPAPKRERYHRKNDRRFRGDE